MKVLLAEDEPISRHLLVGLLSQWGYEAVPAADGDEAWKLLEGDQPPRIALLDWMMPGIDGVTLCRRIRDSERLSATHIILVTGRRKNEDLVEAYAAGADDVVAKPFEHEELKARLRLAARIVELQDEIQELRSR